MIILASEDIGLADPRALQIACDAHYAVKNIGMPEGRIPLAEATIYMARAPKSNSAYKAINEAMNFVKENKTQEVPTHLRGNHPDKKNYKYPHAYPNHWVEQIYAPTGESFYGPGGLGYERMQNEIMEKMKKGPND